MDDFLKLNNHTTPSSGGGSDSDEEPWRFKPIHALLFAGVIGGIGGIIWGIVKLRNWLYDRKEDRRRRRDPEFTKASEAMVILWCHINDIIKFNDITNYVQCQIRGFHLGSCLDAGGVVFYLYLMMLMRIYCKVEDKVVSLSNQSRRELKFQLFMWMLHGWYRKGALVFKYKMNDVSVV